MRLQFGLFAEFVQAPPDGKLYIIGGGIQGFLVSEVPIALPLLSLLLRFEMEPAEIGVTRPVQVQFWTPDGTPLGKPMETTVVAAPSKIGPSSPTTSNVVLQIQGLSFPVVGTYRARISSGKLDLGELAFTILLREQPPSAVPEARQHPTS